MARMSKLTPARQARILLAIEKGCTHVVAARAGGISPRTLYLWLQKGRAARSGKMKAFVEAFEAMEAEVEERLCQIVMTGALNAIKRDKDGNVISVDSSDARWLLQNRYGLGRARHETQRLKIEHEHTIEHRGSEAQPIRVEHVVDLEALADRLAAAPIEMVEHLAGWEQAQEEQEPST